MTAEPTRFHHLPLPREATHSRRSWLTGSAACLGGLALSGPSLAASPAVQTSSAGTPAARPKNPGLRFCLNTSTINGSQVPLREQLRIAAEAGYDGVELWVRDISQYLETGGTLADIRKELSDLGLTLDSAIAFGQWVVDDDAQRKEGLEQCRRDMATVAELGGTHIAAPPSGATKEPGLDLALAGQRYRELLEVGLQTGVMPQVELWGFSQNLSKLEEVLYVAAAAQHPSASILLDVYHLYKGGSDFENLDLVPGRKMPCLHMNDYPAIPDRQAISDKDRVYPGDGVAPLDQILQTLVLGGFAGVLSLELFNRDYWQSPAADVAKTGLEKMQAAVASALA